MEEIRYMEVRSLNDLHIKCSKILDMLNSRNEMIKKRLDDNGVAYSSLGGFGVVVDIDEPNFKFELIEDDNFPKIIFDTFSIKTKDQL